MTTSGTHWHHTRAPPRSSLGGATVRHWHLRLISMASGSTPTEAADGQFQGTPLEHKLRRPASTIRSMRAPCAAGGPRDCVCVRLWVGGYCQSPLTGRLAARAAFGHWGTASACSQGPIMPVMAGDDGALPLSRFRHSHGVHFISEIVNGRIASRRRCSAT